MIPRILSGPFARPTSGRRIAAAGLLIVLLTLLTQIGGFVLWCAYGLGTLLAPRGDGRRGIATALAFATLYAAATVLIVPRIAPAFGRVPLACFAGAEHPYAANSRFYCALNRHYVTPAAKAVVENLANHLSAGYPGTVVSYLDANFPFLDGFPMLPHLSHDDGRKVDLALFYINAVDGTPRPKGGAWPFGYWAFAPAWRFLTGDPASDRDGVLRWRFALLQPMFGGLQVDRARTAEMLRFLSLEPASDPVARVFIEPYLKTLLGVDGPKIGFAGWTAARHDDHIHFQVR